MSMQFAWFTAIIDATTGIIWVEKHISLGSGEPSRRNDDLRSEYGRIIL